MKGDTKIYTLYLPDGAIIIEAKGGTLTYTANVTFSFNVSGNGFKNSMDVFMECADKLKERLMENQKIVECLHDAYTISSCLDIDIKKQSMSLDNPSQG